MKRVLVTHADEPIGRRAVKTLYHDERVAAIFAVGDGPPPRSFDRFLSEGATRVTYARVDLARHRPVTDLFHSSAFRAAEIDTVVHVPRHGAAASEQAPLMAGIAERTAETRLLLQHCLEAPGVASLVAVGSDDQAPVLYDVKPLARWLGLPVAPITPTFPWLGPLGLLPYPVRYRVVYGEPLHFHERFGPEGAEDARLVRYLANQVRRTVQRLIDRKR